MRDRAIFIATSALRFRAGKLTMRVGGRRKEYVSSGERHFTGCFRFVTAVRAI